MGEAGSSSLVLWLCEADKDALSDFWLLHLVPACCHAASAPALALLHSVDVTGESKLSVSSPSLSTTAPPESPSLAVTNSTLSPDTTPAVTTRKFEAKHVLQLSSLAHISRKEREWARLRARIRVRARAQEESRRRQVEKQALQQAQWRQQWEQQTQRHSILVSAAPDSVTENLPSMGDSEAQRHELGGGSIKSRDSAPGNNATLPGQFYRSFPTQVLCSGASLLSGASVCPYEEIVLTCLAICCPNQPSIELTNLPSAPTPLTTLRIAFELRQDAAFSWADSLPSAAAVRV